MGVGVRSDDTGGDSGIYFNIWTQAGGVWDLHIANQVIPGHFENIPAIDRVIIEEKKWYTARVIANGNRYRMFIGDKQIYNFQRNSPDKGRAAVFARHCEVHFDNVVITGADIPDQNLSVSPFAKLAITWATIKQSK